MTEDPRISEIRAVLDEEIPSDQTFDVGNFVKLQRIRDIIDRSAPATTGLQAGRFVDVHLGSHVCVGQVKHLGKATGPLVVVVPEEVTP